MSEEGGGGKYIDVSAKKKKKKKKKEEKKKRKKKKEEMIIFLTTFPSPLSLSTNTAAATMRGRCCTNVECFGVASATGAGPEWWCGRRTRRQQGCKE